MDIKGLIGLCAYVCRNVCHWCVPLCSLKVWYKLSLHHYVPGHPQTFMSLAQLWCWPSARPQYLPLANRLKGPKHPPLALLPVDPKDSHRCTWYASQTSPSLSSEKGISAKIWIENTTLFVRMGKSPGIRAYRAMMRLYQQDASGFATDRALSGHLLWATGTEEPCTPGSNAGAWLCPGWRTLGARGWPRATKPGQLS